MVSIAYICCTLPRRKVWPKESLYKNDNLCVYDTNYISGIFPTTTRYQIAYDNIGRLGFKFDYYMFLGDDCELTENFEAEMLSALQQMKEAVKDDRVCVYPDDGIHGANLATHPCFSREWIEALGYFFPQGWMRHTWVDNYIMDLGKASGRIGYAERAKLIHHHAIRDKSVVMDEYQQRAYSPDFYKEDERRYHELIRTQLASDVEKLTK
jgi:hypothetical protein